MASLFWPLACAVFVYISNHTELLQGLGGPLASFLNINGTFFLTFMGAQSFFAVLLAALAGPGLVAPDLANNALPLYFSRPLSRLDYVLARLLVLAGLLALVTWIPGLLLFGMQVGMAGWSWFAANWTLGAAVAGGFMLMESVARAGGHGQFRLRALAHHRRSVGAGLLLRAGGRRAVDQGGHRRRVGPGAQSRRGHEPDLERDAGSGIETRVRARSSAPCRSA